LIGTGRHAEGAGLDSLPAVKRSVLDLGEVLVERCGLARDRLRIVLDAATPTEIGTALAEEADRATSVLLVYYVGHGLVGLGGELYLATQATDRRPGWLAHTALAYNAVRNSLLESAAASLVVVLDCCYSGRALGVLGSIQDEAADLARVHGGYVLTSAAPDELALAPVGNTYTAFTGELLNLLRAGDPEGPQELTLQYIYRYLARALPAYGGPRPRRIASGRVDDLVLAINRAYRPPATASPGTMAAGGEFSDICPYPGLVAFEPEQADWFFGREQLTAELITRLARRLGEGGPLAVVAPSGTGKSSLLRAGLVPALARGALAAPGSRAWPRVVMTPGPHPLAALAAQVASLNGADSPALARNFVRNPGQYAESFRAVLRARAAGHGITGARVVLIVDQFEDVFTLCADDGERDAFIEVLGTLASGTPDAAPAALVVLGLRADFYGRCAAYPQLRDAVQDDQVLVGPMAVVELREAIERPARAVGLDLEPGLVELLLRDIGVADVSAAEPTVGAYEAGRLPLIAYALQETWRHRAGRTLTVSGYQRTGGIHNAIAATAERTYAALSEAGKQEARPLFMRLVKIGDATQDTRRTVSRTDLLGRSRSSAEAEEILAAFTEARLLTITQDSIEISHEALLQAWPRLRQWLSNDRVGSLLSQELEDAATAWERSARDNSALLRGSRLEAAVRWASERPAQDEASPAARAFLRESQRQQNRARLVRRAAVAVLAVVALIAATTAWYALGQRSAAEASSRQAIFNQVTAEADQVAGTDGSLAAQLNLLAYRMKPTEAAYTKLVSDENTPLAAILLVPSGIARSVTFSTNGRTLAAATNSGVRIWNISGGSDPRLLAPLPAGSGAAFNVAFSTDGRILAAATGSGVRMWDVSDRLHPHLLGTITTGPHNAVSSVAFSPDGHTLAAVTGSVIRLWDVSDPSNPAPLGPAMAARDGAVSSVAFSPNGGILASATGSSVWLWDIRHPAHTRQAGAQLGPLPFRDGHASTIRSIAFSPDGSTLVAGAADNYVHLWRVTNPARPVSLGYCFNDTNAVTAVSISPRGDLLATGSADDTVSVWSFTNPAGCNLAYQTLKGHTGAVLALAISPDGHTLATASADHTIRLWNLPRTVLTGHSGYIDTLALSRARGILASGSADDTFRLWSVANPTRPAPLTGGIHGSGQYNSLGFAPDGRILAAADHDVVELWDTSDPRSPRLLGPALPGYGQYVSSVAFSANGHTLAVSSFGYGTRLWDVADPSNPTPLGPLLAGSPAQGAGSVTFSPRGDTLAVAGSNGLIQLWDVADPAHPRKLGPPLTDHAGSVYSVAFSPNGRTLANDLQFWKLGVVTVGVPCGMPDA
jgi:WD40 repeat protein